MHDLTPAKISQLILLTGTAPKNIRKKLKCSRSPFWVSIAHISTTGILRGLIDTQQVKLLKLTAKVCSPSSAGHPLNSDPSIDLI